MLIYFLLHKLNANFRDLQIFSTNILVIINTVAFNCFVTHWFGFRTYTNKLIMNFIPYN